MAFEKNTKEYVAKGTSVRLHNCVVVESRSSKSAKFIADCFNINQKLDISCYEEVVELLEKVIELSDLWTYGGEVKEEHDEESLALDDMKRMIQQILTKAKRQ